MDDSFILRAVFGSVGVISVLGQAATGIVRRAREQQEDRSVIVYDSEETGLNRRAHRVLAMTVVDLFGYSRGGVENPGEWSPSHLPLEVGKTLDEELLESHRAPGRGDIILVPRSWRQSDPLRMLHAAFNYLFASWALGSVLVSIGVSGHPWATGLGLVMIYLGVASFLVVGYAYGLQSQSFMMNPRYFILGIIVFAALTVTALVSTIELLFELFH